MLKIEKEMVRAVEDVLSGRIAEGAKRFGNTEVRVAVDGDGNRSADVYLYGNRIASIWRYRGRTTGVVTLAGYPTFTTRSRLSALADAFGAPRVRQRDGQQIVPDKGPVEPDEWLYF